MIPASSSGQRVRDLDFPASCYVQAHGEPRATAVAATRVQGPLGMGDVVRVPVATDRLVPGFYLVTRGYGTEVWLAWVAGAAAHTEVVAERHPYALRVDAVELLGLWTELPTAADVGLDQEPEPPLDVPPPAWMVAGGGFAGAPAHAVVDDRLVPVVLGPTVGAGRGVPRARVIQALEAGASPLPVTEWALARVRGGGDVGPVVQSTVEVEVFLPRRSWVRRRVAENPQALVRRMAEPGATPDAVFTLVGDDRRTTP